MDDRHKSRDMVVIERFFEAPADVVWRMWTEPEHFAAWRHFTRWRPGAVQGVEPAERELWDAGTDPTARPSPWRGWTCGSVALA